MHWDCVLPPFLGHPSMAKGLASHQHCQEQAPRTRAPCLPLQPHPTQLDQAQT